jgi:TRAP-type uncharacterized transport system fused permease subunit
MFVYEPALLMIGDWPNIIWSFATASVGICLFAAGLHGYLLTHASWWQRTLLVVGGFSLVDPNFITDVIGAAAVGTVIVTQLLARRAAPPAAAKEASPPL